MCMPRLGATVELGQGAGSWEKGAEAGSSRKLKEAERAKLKPKETTTTTGRWPISHRPTWRIFYNLTSLGS